MRTFCKDKAPAKLYRAGLSRTDTVENYLERHPDFRHLKTAVMAAFQPGRDIALTWTGYEIKTVVDATGLIHEKEKHDLGIFGVDLVSHIEFDQMVAEGDPLKFLNQPAGG
jgi:hypothetical protein